jgi:hypothetical protein
MGIQGSPSPEEWLLVIQGKGNTMVCLNCNAIAKSGLAAQSWYFKIASKSSEQQIQ